MVSLVTSSVVYKSPNAPRSDLLRQGCIGRPLGPADRGIDKGMQVDRVHMLGLCDQLVPVGRGKGSLHQDEGASLDSLAGDDAACLALEIGDVDRARDKIGQVDARVHLRGHVERFPVVLAGPGLDLALGEALDSGPDMSRDE